jgi:hypothetical protein
MNLPTVAYCFVLLVLEGARSGALDQEAAAHTLRITESFLVRRALIGLEPTGLHAAFKRLWGVTGGDPAQVRKELDRATIYFPTDPEVRTKVPLVNMYKRRLAKYIIGEYEREIMSGDLLSEEQLSSFSIDHLAPQSFKHRWMLEYHLKEEETERLLNSWGNLVPLSTPANSSKGAANWDDARAKLRLETIYSSTKRVLDEHIEWTPDAIEERTRVLTGWALERWPDPAVSQHAS